MRERDPASLRAETPTYPRHGVWAAVMVLALTSGLISLPSAWAQPSHSVPTSRPLSIQGATHPADVTVTVTSQMGDTLLTVSGDRLHGVSWMNPRLVPEAPPPLDLATGILSPILRRVAPGARWNATIVPSGRAPFPDRLGWLQDDSSTEPRLGLRAEDFGVLADSTIDNGPALNWTALAAAQLRPSGEIVRIELPPGTIGYTGPVVLPDSVEWVGAGGAVQGPILTDALGNRFQPMVTARSMSRPRATSYTRLRMIDGHAFDAVVSYRQSRSDAPRAPAGTGLALARYALGQEASAFFVASGASWSRLADLELDGNGESSLHQLEATSTYAKESCLRNAPCHTGIAAGNHGGLIVPKGRTVLLERVAVTGYAATGLLGHTNLIATVRDALLGNSLYNHSAYAFDGIPDDPETGWQRATFTGYAWTHLLAYRGLYRQLVFHNLAPNPTGRDGEPIDARMGFVAPGDSLVMDGLYADTVLRNSSGTGVRSSHLAFVNASATGNRTFVLRNAAVLSGPNAGGLVTLRQRGPVVIEGVAQHIDLGAHPHRDLAPFQGHLVSGAPSPGSVARDIIVTLDTTGMAAQAAPGGPDIHRRQYVLLHAHPQRDPTALQIEHLRLGWPLRTAAADVRTPSEASPTTIVLCDARDVNGAVPLRYRQPREAALLRYVTEPAPCSPR